MLDITDNTISEQSISTNVGQYLSGKSCVFHIKTFYFRFLAKWGVNDGQNGSRNCFQRC